MEIKSEKKHDSQPKQHLSDCTYPLACANQTFSMANTYTQLHHQFVFATQYRAASIKAFWQEQLHKYITGIVQGHQHKMLQKYHARSPAHASGYAADSVCFVVDAGRKIRIDEVDQSERLLWPRVCLAGRLWGV